MAQWVGVQGQVKVAKNSQNIPTYGSPPTEPQTKNEKRFFFDFKQKTGWIREWFRS